MSRLGWLYRLRWLLAGLTPGERKILRAGRTWANPDQFPSPAVVLLEGEETVHTTRLADADLVVRRHGNGDFSVEKNRWGTEFQHAPWDALPDYVKRAVKP